jgi:hypothetical protein
MSWRGLIILTKLGTNLLTKLIFPRKDFMDFLLHGNGILEINLGSFRFYHYPDLGYKKSQKFSFIYSKNKFPRVERYAISSTHVKYFFKWYR